MPAPRLYKKPRFRDIIRENWAFDATVYGMQGAGSFVTASQVSSGYYFGISVGCGILTLFLASWKILANLRSSNDTDWLLPMLKSTLYQLQAVGKRDEKLRICILVRESSETTRQVTEYVGGNFQGKKGRRFNRRKGMVGLAIRKKGGAFGAVPPNMTRENYLRALAYDDEEIAAMTKDRQSWGAYCIGDPKMFQAIIFCDSSDPEYFGKYNDKGKFQPSYKQKLLSAAGFALAEYLHARYPYKEQG